MKIIPHILFFKGFYAKNYTSQEKHNQLYREVWLHKQNPEEYTSVILKKKKVLYPWKDWAY